MRILPAVLAAASLAACVPKKDYQALEAELAATRSQLNDDIAARDGKISSLEEALANSKAAAEQLGKDIADLQGRYDEKAALAESLTAEKATLVKDKSRLRASVKEMEEALIELAARKAAADKRVAAYQDLLDRFKALIDAGRLRVKIVDGRMVVELATDILFASGKAELSEEGTSALTEVAKVLADIPDRRYQVEGHTDDVPISTSRFPSNWELASARAIVVVKALIEGGISADRVSAASYSEHRPVGDNDTDEGKAANRRIEIVVVPDLTDLPGFDELEALDK